MDGPELRRLALILSKHRAANGNVTYEFGTGYFVAPKLVLTASHVVPEDAEEVCARVESSGERHYADLADSRVKPAWRDARLDAVLLKVSPGLNDAGPIGWMERLPESDLPWRSTAYPDAASQTIDQHTQFKTSGMKGEIYSQGGGGQGPRELELIWTNPAEPEASRGISGAPVFVKDKVAGIIRQVSREHKGRVLALPAPTLLAVAGFRQALEPQWLDWPAEQRWMLVLKSAQSSNELEDRANAALKTFNSRYLAVTGGQPFREDPIVAPIVDALESPGRWLHLVKALCAAPVLLADVTQFQPGVMVALGVRAVVRRAVTLTSTGDRYSEAQLRHLPFNIQEAKLTCHGGKFQPKDPNNPVTVISQAIKDGLLESHLHPRYLDLPAYDAVRCPVPETAVGLQAARESVLVLCAFHPDYAENWLAISDYLATYYAPKPPVRMLDLGSPRLVGQALYEYIRWAGTCIVDWTFWRPNVFFELGVRLACSTAGSISIIDEEKADSIVVEQKADLQEREQKGQDEQKGRLLKLFGPVKYRRDSPDSTLKAHFYEHEQRVSGKTVASALDSLPYDATYQVAIEFFDWEQDDTTTSPHDLLKASVKDNVGKDPQRSGVPPVLFSSNPAFGERVRTSMQERWIAAWYYLTERFPDEIKTQTNLRKQLKDVAENVVAWIPSDTKDQTLKKLLKDVWVFIDEYESSLPGGTDGNRVG